MNELTIDRKVEFRADAVSNKNFKGNWNPHRIWRDYNFTEVALDTTNKYTTYLDTTSTVAVGSGGCKLTTAATDTKTATITCGGIYWLPTKNPVVEMRFEIDVITNVAIYAGFGDAASHASSLLPFGLVTATLTATATDGAGFLFDTRQTLAYFNYVNVKATVKAFTQLSSAYVPVAATRLTLMTAINSSGHATFYWNGKPVGYKANAVSTGVNLVPFFGIRNNSGAAHVATLRSVRVWQDD